MSTRRTFLSLIFFAVLAVSQGDAANGVANGGADADVGKSDGPSEGLFERMDVNHDQLLNKDEFVSGWKYVKEDVVAKGGWSLSFLLPDAAHYHGGFWKGFTSGVAMILATEIGDKTFFIAAVLSMRQERQAVFIGAVLSLYIMTILSSVMGLLLPKLLSPHATHLCGGLLFMYFGVKLLLDSRKMESNRVSEELEEVEEELLHPKKDDEETNHHLELSSGAASSNSTNSGSSGFSKVAFQSFMLTFVAEWGDRSQIATIALSAAKNPYGVTVGGCIGHTLCTGVAVLGGRMLAARISEKTVSLGGGVIFLIFGIHSLVFES